MNEERAKEIIKKFEKNKDLFNWCEEYKQFVNDNIIYCVSTEWDYMIKKSYEDSESPCDYEDIETTYLDVEEARIDLEILFIDDEERTKEKREELKKELQYLDDIDDIENFANENSLDFDRYDYEHQIEVYEWWLCSNYLKDLMNDEIFLNGAWGRQTTGQHISLDYCMIQAYLKHLKNCWIKSEVE